MNLNLILPLKKIILPQSNKKIMIPKLGLKHYNLLKDVKGPDENMKILADSICKNMSPADFDFACLHILEFNNKLKSEVEKDGFTYKLDDVYVCQRTEFQFQGNTFYFRPPGKFEQFATISEMLSNCLIKVNDEEKEISFLEMPAFVIKWAEDLSTTIAIPGPNGPIKGIAEIIGLLE
ncbi:baseplate hub assembly protein [Escherichia phage PTK]|uniref:Baseplate hub assembly protein n=1 Tax=Escherichia phage PTK TaxID=2809110 RepID=A0A899IN49_9CAUD|nr:baseplate hub assembly protein [Escherichia phage PTK]QXV75032.1 baseplate hub distal subunit [Escherichia phage AlbertHofmann]